MSDLDTFSGSAMDGERDGSITISGTTPPTFDDFDDVEEAREDYKAAQEAENAPKQKPEAEAGETLAADPEDQKEDVKAEPVAKEEDEAPAVEERTPASDLKMVKGATLGGDDFELPQDLSIPVKIDGELVDVSVQDLVNNHSGRESWNRKFSELDLQRKEFEKGREEVFDVIEGFSSLHKEGKSLDAMKYLLDITGADSHDFHMKLREAMIPEIESWLYMTDGEREAHDTALELDYMRGKVATQADDRKFDQENWESELETSRLRESLGVSEQEYTEAVSFLRSEGIEGTPEVVGEYYLNIDAINKSTELLTSVNEDLSSNDELKVEVAHLLRSGEYTELEIKSQLSEAYSKKGASAVNAKLEQGKPKVEQSHKPTVEQATFESFDDFEQDEYYY